MGEEKRIENSIKRYVEENLNCWLLKIQGGANSKTTGVPDIFFGYRGYVIFVEAKTPDGLLSKIQKYQIKDLRKKGNIAIVASDLKTVQEMIKHINELQDDKLIFRNKSIINSCNEMGWNVDDT